MDLAKFVVTIIMLIGSFGAFMTGMINPSLFKKLLGVRATHRNIALCSVGLFIVSLVLYTVYEPANLKEARIARQNESKTTQQHDASEELQEQEGLSEQTIEIQQSASQSTENNIEAPSPEQATPAPESIPTSVQSRQVKKPIRKDDRKRCYAPGTKGYDKLDKFKSFNTMLECVISGRRPAKN